MTTTFNATALANGTSTLTQRTAALATSTDLVQAGATFNDATRLLDGGLWDQANTHNQAPYLGMYTSDIQAVLNDVTGMLATPGSVTVGGQTFHLNHHDTQVLTQVEGQLQTLLADAPLSVGNSTAATTAQTAIHTLQTSIISEIQGDHHLAHAIDSVTYLGGTGNPSEVGFQALPVGSDTATDLSNATAAGATLAQIGTVYNAAADLAVGGLNSSNLTEFGADIQAVATGVQHILNSPTALASIECGETAQQAALTTIHLQTVENELTLQLNTVDGLYTTDPNRAARETNDNLLDMIDIVQNDANLNTAAGGQGTPTSASGFGELPSYLTGTINHYQDTTAAETSFWANFITEANVLGAETVSLAQQGGLMSSNAAIVSATHTLIADIQAYQQYGANFSTSEGGLFAARFDNELVNGTLEADSSAAIAALQQGNVGQAQAAAQGFVADAADVSGNNVPLGGGTFNSELLTVNGVDAPNPNATVAGATTPNGIATAAAVTTTAIADAATAQQAVAGASSTSSNSSGTGTTSDSHHHDTQTVDISHHHFGHMWG